MGFVSALTLILITLKLTGYIALSWWWILGPIVSLTSLGFIFIAALLYSGAKVKKIRVGKRWF